MQEYLSKNIIDNKNLLNSAQVFLKTFLKNENVLYADYIDRLKIVRDGINISTVTSWVDGGFIEEELFYDILINEQSLENRKQNDYNKLTPHESDVAIRIASLISYALAYFENNDKAIYFVNNPCKKLSNNKPLKFVDTQCGYEYVITKLLNNELVNKD